MTKQKSGGSNKQSSTESGSKQSGAPENSKSGKDAESHSKATDKKTAGGGAKQSRKH